LKKQGRRVSKVSGGDSSKKAKQIYNDYALPIGKSRKKSQLQNDGLKPSEIRSVRDDASP